MSPKEVPGVSLQVNPSRSELPRSEPKGVPGVSLQGMSPKGVKGVVRIRKSVDSIFSWAVKGPHRTLEPQ